MVLAGLQFLRKIEDFARPRCTLTSFGSYNRTLCYVQYYSGHALDKFITFRELSSYDEGNSLSFRKFM